MTEEGSLDEDQGDLISSALQFGDVTVESVLTPRVDIVAININSSHAELLSLIKSTNHSRLPVYEGSIDNIIGVLQIRKYIKAYLRLGENLDIKPMLDEVLFVHQSTNIDELLPILSKRKLNIAVVTDNYGGTVGIVTMEDILEELVGEIWDEHDEVIENFREVEDGVFHVVCSAARYGTRTTLLKSLWSRSATAYTRSARMRPSATCSISSATRTPKTTRSL